MYIDLSDPELLRRIAEEEEAERQLMMSFKQPSTSFYVSRIDVAGEKARQLDDDMYLSLFSPQVRFEEKENRIDLVRDKGGATEAKAVMAVSEAMVRINSDPRLKGDGVVAPLPPTRGHMGVSGQMKIAVDVALSLKEMRKSDKVIVIGSAAAEGYSGESYRLLAGAVAQVDLYDPREEPQEYEVDGTRFRHCRESWPQSKVVEADVVFMDAYDNEKRRACEFDVKSRVYSIKEVSGQDSAPYKIHPSKRYPRAYNYEQLSGTRERRYTSMHRYFSNYRGRLGDCAACREVDYRGQVEFTPTQYSAWVVMHSYTREKCSIATHIRSALQTYASTVTWRTEMRPVVLEHYTRGRLIELNTREMPPRRDITKAGYEWFGQTYVYVTREEQIDDIDDRPPTARFPRYIVPARAAVTLTILERDYNLPGSPTGGTWGLLVIDTYVYALCFGKGEERPRRVRRVDGRVLEDYSYGPVASPIPIGPWVAYRHEKCVAKGRSGDILSMRVLITRKTGEYTTMGGWRGTD